MVTLAEIFRQHGPAYREKFGERMPSSHHRAVDAIEQCRSEVLGGRVYRCPDCGEERFSYHSCKNGFFSAGQRKVLQRVRQLLGVSVASPEPEQETSGAQPRRPDMRCPTCNQVMHRVSRLRPSKRDPPR